MLGETFGKWQVIKEREGTTSYGQRKCLCRCKCGVVRAVQVGNLRAGLSTCCGSVACRGPSKLIKHGGSGTAEYNIWCSMLKRCRNPNEVGYKNYGGRGIAVCKRWEKYEHFIADMGVRPSTGHSIDRINNDKGYSPANCRWATRAVQNTNRRDNILYTYKGVRQTLSQWAAASQMSHEALRRRWHKGLRGQELFAPPRKFNDRLLVKHQGKVQTLKLWADAIGVPPVLMYGRYRKGLRGVRLFAPLRAARIDGAVVAHNGRQITLKELADTAGISGKVLNKRYHKGLRGDGLVAPVRPSKGTLYVTYKGITKTFKEWAEETGLAHKNLAKRYRTGMRGALLFSPANEPRHSRYITYKGVKAGLMQWAKTTGIAYSTLRHRLGKGLRGDALFAPARPREKS